MTHRKNGVSHSQWRRHMGIGAFGLALSASLVLAQTTAPAQHRSAQDRARIMVRTAQTRPAETDRSGQRGQMARGQQQAEDQEITSRLRLVPEGWVTIGYDFDGDGRYDAVERIYASDIQQARTRSQARREERQPGRGGMAQADRSRGSGLLERSRRFLREQEESWRRGFGMEEGETHRLEGEITELNTVHMAGMRHPHLFGRVRDERGQTARVDFGPRDVLGRLNLRTGDKVTIVGTPGRYHERSVLLAQRVEANNESVTVDRPRGRGLLERAGERVRGEFLAFRRAAFRGHPHDHLLARVRLEDGTVETVDLGPVDELEQIHMRRGDQVELVVHRARINGEPAYLAEQFRTEDGQVVQIDVTEDRGQRPRLRGTPVAPRQQERGAGGLRDQESRSGQESFGQSQDFYDQTPSQEHESGAREQDRTSRQDMSGSPRTATTRPSTRR